MENKKAVNNKEKRRFVIVEEGMTSLAAYEISDGDMELYHTEVPARLEGRGIGSALAKAALDYAQENGLEVIPSCPFIAAYIERHPEYQELVVA